MDGEGGDGHIIEAEEGGEWNEDEGTSQAQKQRTIPHAPLSISHPESSLGLAAQPFTYLFRREDTHSTTVLPDSHAHLSQQGFSVSKGKANVNLIMAAPSFPAEEQAVHLGPRTSPFSGLLSYGASPPRSHSAQQ